MASVKSDSKNAEWAKHRDSAHVNSCETADSKSEDDEKEVKVTGIEGEDIVGVEAATAADVQKSTKDTVWDQTRDMAENIAGMAGNVSHTVYNKGSEICGAMKHGAEAGWNKTAD
ncbi:uncharacterized protein LOC119074903 [Bradysia coprophila]|uniref:uncharacterized protein LOC119074903 n=1 Tax=Bradysia coprophila TaxID=38358 RepID=UPI00187D7E44|nr:uncharacterized protein LOC119074903 [Bradysia coprophila]